jgi:KDO2-lipid IV(A) lauroyltransferase
MDLLLTTLARLVIAGMQALPLGTVARLGRACGAMLYLLDRRHRRVALTNLAGCFPEKSAAEVHALTKENFRRIGENFACAAKTAAFSAEEIRTVLTCTGTEKFPFPQGGPPPSVVVAIGHFGNFELYARTNLFVPGYQMATTYRGLRQPGVNELMQSLRAKSGALYFERRRDAAALKDALTRPGLMLGLLADQHAGDRGARLPFFGRDCSTSLAAPVLALRYGCRLHTCLCQRTAPGRWRLEFGEEIPTHEHGKPRSPEAIATDINRVFEAAIRRDPANWFWVHNRWKEGKWRKEMPSDAIPNEQ